MDFRKPAQMVQTSSSTEICPPIAGPHPLSHHLEKIRKRGLFEKGGRVKGIEIKMTSYNVIKIAAYYYKMAAYYYKMTVCYYNNMFSRAAVLFCM